MEVAMLKLCRVSSLRSRVGATRRGHHEKIMVYSEW